MDILIIISSVIFIFYGSIQLILSMGSVFEYKNTNRIFDNSAVTINVKVIIINLTKALFIISSSSIYIYMLINYKEVVLKHAYVSVLFLIPAFFVLYEIRSNKKNPILKIAIIASSLIYLFNAIHIVFII